MKKTFITLFTLLLLLILSGCSKDFKSSEELGETHFKLYFDVLQDKDVDVTKQCTLIYATDYISYCENTMADFEELLEIRMLSEDDFELYEVTSEIMEDTMKDLSGFSDYDEVYEVTISYGITLPLGDGTEWDDYEYTMYVVEIDKEYKAIRSDFSK